MELARARNGMVLEGEWRRMSQTARFQETLRKLTIFDEGLVEAGFGLDLAQTSALEAKIAALLQVAVSVAMGVGGGLPAMERRPGDGGGRE
jgi:hypothetical protein